MYWESLLEQLINVDCARVSTLLQVVEASLARTGTVVALTWRGNSWLAALTGKAVLATRILMTGSARGGRGGASTTRVASAAHPVACFSCWIWTSQVVVLMETIPAGRALTVNGGHGRAGFLETHNRRHCGSWHLSVVHYGNNSAICRSMHDYVMLWHRQRTIT